MRRCLNHDPVRIFLTNRSVGQPVIIIIIHDFHGDTNLKQNFRAASQSVSLSGQSIVQNVYGYACQTIIFDNMTT